VTLDRVETPRGELVLRRRDGIYEIISNGTFLMDTGDGRSERLLVDAALDRCAAPAPPGADRRAGRRVSRCCGRSSTSGWPR